MNLIPYYPEDVAALREARELLLRLSAAEIEVGSHSTHGALDLVEQMLDRIQHASRGAVVRDALLGDQRSATVKPGAIDLGGFALDDPKLVTLETGERGLRGEATSRLRPNWTRHSRGTGPLRTSPR